MQDRYAGDVGDYGKYGLLRRLCRRDAHGPEFRLGVLWYLTEDAKPGDGEKLDYLDPPLNDEFRRCDPALFEKMRSVVHGGARSVAFVEACGALPANTVFFRDKLVFEPYQKRASRASNRRDWVETGLRAVKDAHLVFADPDTGLEVSSKGPLSGEGPKYAFYEDLLPCWRRGQSLVIYQHIARNESAEEQIATRLDELRRRFAGACGAFAARYRRGTSRAYFVIPAAAHAERLVARCRDLLASAWGRGPRPLFT
ncbi:MAG: hypothetical protein OXH04_16400 [Acidobacteria bacterium]|nr:hypothetical protein [Acidobacteriota bacterium]